MGQFSRIHKGYNAGRLLRKWYRDDDRTLCHISPSGWTAAQHQEHMRESQRRAAAYVTKMGGTTRRVG